MVPRLTAIFLIAACAMSAWLIWLDIVVTGKFEGARWSLPARVYAAPVEIFTGQRLPPSDFENALRRAGYREAARLDRPGDYRRQGESSLQFFARRFDYWDGSEPARRLTVTFNGDVVTELSAVGASAAPAVARIEPPLVGKIYPRQNEDRVLIRFEDVPQQLIHALVAIEDRNFFRHSGIDAAGIARAAWANLRARRIVQGGSTITQQLVKNMFLEQERTFTRKINEIFMSLLLERRFSKEQILEAYINEIYLGQHGAAGVHGFGTAAEFYFNRPLPELGIHQIALLTSLARGASHYNPRRHPVRALARRNLVLSRLGDQGFLDKDLAAAAARMPLDISATPPASGSDYPAFLSVVRQQLLRDYPREVLQSEGLRIFTTLDPDLQESAAAATRIVLASLERERGLKGGTLQASIVIADSASGEIRAVIGGRSDMAGGFNRAMNARRPVGSLIKPFVYLAALSRPDRYNVLSTLEDTPLRLDGKGRAPWEPKNYDREFHGNVHFLEALPHSYNVATVRLGMELGLDRIISVLRNAGLDAVIPAVPSILLGALELTPLEALQIYQTLSNGGFMVPLNGIREVLDRDGRGIRRYGLELRQSLDAGAAALTTDLLVRAVTVGTARRLGTMLPGRLPLAGKTGTTNDLRDSWFAGYGNPLVAVAWIGRDDNAPIGLSGATGAMRLWAETMAHSRLAPLAARRSAGVETLPPVRVRYRGQCVMAAGLPFLAPHRPEVPPCD
jgi:penicillin-binding protein 1B